MRIGLKVTVWKRPDVFEIFAEGAHRLRKNFGIIPFVVGSEGDVSRKLCIHPKEIEIIHRFYTPTIKEYEHSCRVVELYEKAEQRGDGVAIIDGIYVAPPMVKYAQKIIKKYETYCSSKH